MNRSIHVALCVYASIVFGEGNDREFVFRGREVPSSRRIFLGKKSGSIPVDRGRGNVASVRFARRMAKGRRMKGGGWTNGWTSFTHRRRAYLANDERRGWRYKGGSSLFVAANSIQTASLNLYSLLAILPSIFETDFSFAREKRIFNSLSNFLRSNNCPVISKRVSSFKQFFFFANREIGV